MNQQNPSNSRKHRALALFRAGQLAQAKTLYEEVCGVDRSDAEAWYMLGTVHGIQGDSRQAESCLRRAIELRPTYALAYSDLGLELYHQDRIDEAIACYKKALQLQPDLASAHCNLGLALYAARNFEESVISCQRALRLRFEHHEVYNTLGLSLDALGRQNEALGCYRKAVQLKSDFPDAYNNAALILLAQGKFREGLMFYREALKLRPDYAQLLNHAGDSHHRAYPVSLLHSRKILLSGTFPQDLRGKRILIGEDQGLGDQFFFLRFVPQLKARGAWVAYCPDPRVASILNRVGCIDRLVTQGEPLDAVAYTFMVGDLLLLSDLGHASTVPPPLPLTPLPERLEAMRQKLSALGPPPYVGVTWRAGTKEKGKLYKEVPLEELAAVLRDRPATAVILQRHPQPGEVEAFIKALGRAAHDMSAVNEDLEDMLALLDLLEDYVGVSNTNMHLRAGLGKTARVLVPRPPEWRWMAEGGEPPWFPGFAAYRPGAEGDWQEAFGRLTGDLTQSLSTSPHI